MKELLDRLCVSALVVGMVVAALALVVFMVKMPLTVIAATLVILTLIKAREG